MRVLVLKWGSCSVSQQAHGAYVVLQMAQIPQTADHRGRISLEIVVTEKARDCGSTGNEGTLCGHVNMPLPQASLAALGGS